MKVLVTGGTGFIGSRLALRCIGCMDSVKVLGQENTLAEKSNRDSLEANKIEVILGSVTDKAELLGCLHGIDVVFHLAAIQHEANVPDQKFWEVNVEGTRNVLDACVAAGVKRLVHGSTIGVYGLPSGGKLDECSPTLPENIYGVTKLEGERIALSYQHKLEVVVLRISETYGPGDRRLLKLFKAIRKHMFFVIGRGENLHQLIYIDDLVNGFLLAATSNQAPGKVFVLAGKESLSTNEMARTIARELGTSIPRVHAPFGMVMFAAILLERIMKPLRIQPPLHRRRMDFFRKSMAFSLEEAENELGFRPSVSFDAGVRETARWYVQMGYM